MHTPGPWSFYGDCVISPPLPVPNPNVEPYEKNICKLGWDFDGDRSATERRTKWREAEANGRLMAAAPDLLEALECMIKHYAAQALYATDWSLSGNSQTDAVLRFARSAIQKARG